MTEHLNQLFADTMTLRDLYKKSHWQISRQNTSRVQIVCRVPERSQRSAARDLVRVVLVV
jgi:hypothetical protein